MNSSTCLNCGNPKTIDFYGENYCEPCTKAIKEAREYAIREKVDIGQATRSALAVRAHSPNRNRIDPRFPIGKQDYWAAQAPKTGEEGVVILVICIVILLLSPVFMAMPLG